MTAFRNLGFIGLVFITIIISGCYEEYYEIVNPEKEVFDFVMTDSQRLYINKIRYKQFDVTNPVPILNFAGKTYLVDRFEIRGDNTINFERKGFGVNLDNKITLYDPHLKAERKYEEFKMLAMVYDYTYIENCVAVELFHRVDLWPVGDFFTEVRLNGISQGLYHVIEDPFEYFIEKQDASFVLRRGYAHTIKTSTVGVAPASDSLWYVQQFNKINHLIVDYSEQQLYDSLSMCIDLEQYFTKLSIDMLIKNGDYTDEVIYFTKWKNGHEVFGVFPWDYDDIFVNEPHEIGRQWAVGTLFGYRNYNNMNDVYNAVGHKLLFSIEEDLDYKIATDSVLYHHYLVVLKSVMDRITSEAIDQVFDYTYEHISPFYNNPAIIEQSQYDVDETNWELFVRNISQKRQMLKSRRDSIANELNLQQIK